MNHFVFADRTDAGRALARELSRYAGRDDLLVLALLRGGAPIGFEIARHLHAPMDVFLVRKLGVPDYEELAMGAIASGGTRVINDAVVRQLGITEEQIEEVARREQRELERREAVFRNGAPPVDVAGRTCILVDDGLATGSTMRAAVQALKNRGPGKIIVAVPVASSDTCAEFDALVDEMVCLYTPEPFQSVGRWYDDFAQLTDDEVRAYLGRAAHEMAH
jgi:putative phosphoribosyl transferase